MVNCLNICCKTFISCLFGNSMQSYEIYLNMPNFLTTKSLFLARKCFYKVIYTTIRRLMQAPNCMVIVWLLYGYSVVRVPKIV